MRALALVLSLSLSIPIVAYALQMAPTGENQAIRKCIELYFEGAATAKTEPFEKAWNLEHGRMLSLRNRDGVDELQQTPIAEAITKWTANPAEESWGKILSIDEVDGKMAVAKVELLFRGHIYVDMLSLYKINGEWKIVNKLYVSRGRVDSAESLRPDTGG